MSRKSEAPVSRWMSFELESNHFGEQVEFREDGVVRLGNKAFAEGRRIDFTFSGNVASRTNAFGAILTIRSSDNQEFHFRFDGEQWLRLVEDFDSAKPLLYSLRQEMARTGAVLGAVWWLLANGVKAGFVVYVIIFPLLLLRDYTKPGVKIPAEAGPAVMMSMVIFPVISLICLVGVARWLRSRD